MADPPLAAAAAAADLDLTGARLLHARANAVYHLPSAGAVVRLRHTRDSTEWPRRLASAVAVTAHLHRGGFATVQPLDVDQPATIEGWTVTYWRYVEFAPTAGEAGTATLGRRLADLHARPLPPVQLEATNPLGAFPDDLEALGAAVLTPRQHGWLRDRAAQLAESYASADLPLGRGLVHGDAHTGNLFPTAAGWLLGDWDSVSYGPRVQDLIPTLDGVRHFGADPATWTQLCAAYGAPPDLAEDPGVRLLAEARELRSLAAYLRAAEQPAVRAELDKRLATLIDGTPSTWRAV